MRVTKAVLPVAGLGTRFLPVTKSVPKEMLPIVDRPCLDYIVAEAVEAGLSELIFVSARGKDSMIEYFQRSPELEANLEAAGKRELAREVRRLGELATVVTVRQQEQLGLGHAVLAAAPATGDEPFAVFLGDDVIRGERPAIRQLLDVHEERGGCVVALWPVPREETKRYGICGGPWVNPKVMQVQVMVEKPDPADAPSCESIVGRYVLPGGTMDILRTVKPGRGGEIQLTDALAVLASRGEAWGTRFEGERFDTGTPLGLLRASLFFALQREDTAAGARAILEELRGQ